MRLMKDVLPTDASPAKTTLYVLSGGPVGSKPRRRPGEGSETEFLILVVRLLVGTDRLRLVNFLSLLDLRLLSASRD